MAALLIASSALGALIYYSQTASIGGPTTPGVSQSLDERISNGYQFRDLTYNDTIDIAHPDVKNNLFALSQPVTKDRGTNGIPRVFVQLYPGSSEITHLSRADNLFL